MTELDPAAVMAAHEPCCSSCKGVGGDYSGICWDCRGTGCDHPPDPEDEAALADQPEQAS